MKKKLSTLEKLNVALKEEKEVAIIKKNIITNIIVNISENSIENDFFKEKTLEILNIQANASIQLGKIFEEVANKTEDKSYCKWLEYVGYTRTTAFRHRRRYELYELAETEKGKEIVALLTFRELDTFYQNVDKNLEKLNKNEFTPEQFKRYLIESKQLLLSEDKQKEEQNKNKINLSIKNWEEKIEKLPKNKQAVVNKLLYKIEKILDSI